MNPSTPLRLAAGALFLLYLVPWLLLAYSLYEGDIAIEPSPSGGLVVRNSSPMEVEIRLAFYSDRDLVGAVEMTLPPGSSRGVELDPALLAAADGAEMVLRSMGVVEVRARWSLRGG